MGFTDQHTPIFTGFEKRGSNGCAFLLFGFVLDHNNSPFTLGGLCIQRVQRAYQMLGPHKCRERNDDVDLVIGETRCFSDYFNMIR
ncbi:hypothetical protein D9M69_586360 [compost metagenome]